MYLGCDYEARVASSVKLLKANVHDIDVVFYPCNKCNYEAKQSGTLKRHKANVHDIDVVYYPCSAKGCNLNQRRKVI